MRSLAVIALLGLATASAFNPFHMDNLAVQHGKMAEMLNTHPRAAFNTALGHVRRLQDSGNGGGNGCDDSNKDQGCCKFDNGIQTALMGEQKCIDGGLATLMSMGSGSDAPDVAALTTVIEAICTNGCHDAAVKYFTDNKAAIDAAIKAKEVGCRSFMSTRATILKRICSQDKAGKYCFVELMTMGPMLEAMGGGDDSGSMRRLQDGSDPTPEQMEQALAMMCGPCMRMAIQWGGEDEAARMQYDADSDSMDMDEAMGVMDLMCMKAGGKYCMIEMMAMAQQDSGSGNDGSPFGGPEAEKFICENPCGRPVMSAMMSMGGGNSACDKANKGAFMKMMGAMCGKNTKGVRCGTYMMAMGSGSDGGSQTGSTRALRALADPTDSEMAAAGEAFMGMMTKCDPGDAAPTACPTGCADAIDAVHDNVGCCFNAVFSVIRNFEAAHKVCQGGGADSGPSFDEQVKSIESVCDRTLQKCKGRKVSKKMRINNVKYSYLKENAAEMTKFKNAFIRMLSKQFAAPEEWFTVTSVEEGSVVVNYDIEGDSDDATEALAADLDSAAEANEINLAEIDAAIPDNSDARDDPLAGLEAASAAPPPSPASTTFLSFAAAVLSVLAAALLA